MGLPGRTAPARSLLLPVVLSGVLAGIPMAAPAAATATPAPADRAAAVRAPAAGAAAAREPAGGTAGRDGFVPGRVLVGFEAAAGDRGRRTAAAAVGGRVVGRHGRTGLVALGHGADVRAAARRLAERPEVAFAEPDWIRRVDTCPPSVCWHLQPRPGANVAAAHADGLRGDGRTVAVVDTGVAEGIADLEGRVAERWRCNPTCSPVTPAPATPGPGATPAPATPPPGATPAPADPLLSPHGTEVASVIAANDDGVGTTGVAPRATIVSYRVDHTLGIPSSFLGSALLQIAADPDVDVVNLSLSGTQWSAFEEDGIKAVLAAGKVVVASSGNFGNRIPQYPAAFPGVVSVGASDADARIASFSSYGKVDVVAPGVCIPVAEVTGLAQPPVCDGDTAGDGVAYDSGTSFAAPIVSGLLVLAGDDSPLLARLTLAASAAGGHPAGDVKRWAHGLADAGAFVDAHRPDAPPSVVLETSGQDEQGRHRLGSGNGQLPHPSTAFVAYAFHPGGLARNPGQAEFAGADDATRSFQEVDGEPGTFSARLDSRPLEPGIRQETATATLDGVEATGTVPVLVLAPDDQAPGVPLAGAGDDAWRRVDSVAGDDLDDVYAVALDKGDRLDAVVADLSPNRVAVTLLKPGTVDVVGQRTKQTVACGGPQPDCPTTGLHFEAAAAGTYLLDVSSTGPTGGYRLTWTVRNAAGPPVEVPVPACSPNGDGVQDRCAWTAGAVSGWTTTSFITIGAELVKREAGPGPHSWDGRDEAGTERAAGRYMLRILSTRPDGRALLRAVVVTLDSTPPDITAATAAPNPFEPRPADGDRDTTTFAMTSSEPGRLRVIIYRPGGSEAVRVLVGDSQAAGRQQLGWSGRTSSGAWLRGSFSYVIEATDAAGNTARSRRHDLRVL